MCFGLTHWTIIKHLILPWSVKTLIFDNLETAITESNMDAEYVRQKNDMVRIWGKCQTVYQQITNLFYDSQSSIYLNKKNFALLILIFALLVNVKVLTLV